MNRQAGFEVDSRTMEIFKKLGNEHVAWSLRRAYCPVDRDAMVLEVGSGESPYYRAKMLCVAYEETPERYFASQVHDRPTVVTCAEGLPVKDETFDFVIASHVLEHSAHPERFLSEIQHVGKAGYIEVPDAFMERTAHYGFHRLEITDDEYGLINRKKKEHIQDEEIVRSSKNKVVSLFLGWAQRHKLQLHVRYYWSKATGGIHYTVLNPDCKGDWPAIPVAHVKGNEMIPFVAKAKGAILDVIRKLCSQSKRNNLIDLIKMLKCPKCGCERHAYEKGILSSVCTNCGERHKVYIQGYCSL